MTIKNNIWHARDDRMPGTNTLTVTGIVPTSASYAFPFLTLSKGQSEAGQLNLDLAYYAGGIPKDVWEDAPVKYTQPSDATITTVHVYQNDQLLVCIDDVEVTH